MKGLRHSSVLWVVRGALLFVSSFLLGVWASSSFVVALNGSLAAAVGAALIVGVSRWYRREVRRRLLSERLSRTVLRSAQRAAVRSRPWRTVAPGTRRDVSSILSRSASVRREYAALVTFGLQHVGRDQ